MKVNQSKSLRIAIAAAIAVATCQIANAVSLGPISVNSSIGEPLKASITVSGMDASEAAKASVKVAGNAAYQSRGIKKLPVHDKLKFSLSPSGSGYVINVSSAQQIREPFINFLLSMDADGKEIVREYAVFLNPGPGVISSVSAPEPEMLVQAEQVPDQSGLLQDKKLLTLKPASTTISGWQGKNEVTPVKTGLPTPVAVAAAQPVQSSYQGNTYGPVKPGETLYSIATKVRPSADYPMQKVMQQIYRANRSAFGSSSLGSLMAGSTLTIPDFNRNTAPVTTVSNNAGNLTAEPKKLVVTSPQPANNLPKKAEQAEEKPLLVEENIVETNDTEPQLLNNNEEMPVVEVDDGAANEQEGNVVVSDDVPVVDEPLAVSEMSISDSEQPAIIVEEVAPQAESPTVVVEQPAVTAAETASAQSTTPEQVPESNFFKDLYATLPLWIWAAIVGLILALVGLLFVKRRKSGDEEYEEAVLDQEEMDAVLAKINAMEDEHPEHLDAQLADIESVNFDELHASSDEQSEEADLAPLSSMVEDDFFTQDDEHNMAFDDHGLAADTHDFDMDAHEINISEEAFLDTGKEDYKQNEYDIFMDDDDFMAEDKDPKDLFVEDHGKDFLLNEADEYESEKADEAAPPAEANQEEDFGFLTDGFDDDFFVEDSPAQESVFIDSTEVGEAEVEDESLDFVDATSIPEIDDTESAPEDMAWLDELVLEGDDEPVANEKSVEQQKTSAAKPTPAPAVQTNSKEMEINLDLANSFIATGHGERAISWLEEVLEMGTDEQKSRANELLTKIRGA